MWSREPRFHVFGGFDWLRLSDFPLMRLKELRPLSAKEFLSVVRETAKRHEHEDE